MLGRVIVLVREDQLSLAIGKKGQNVRLASKLVGWDIDVMTREELDTQLDRSVQAFAEVPHVTEELAEALVSQGFFSFEDLSVIEPDQLAELGGLTPEQCDEIVARAEEESQREEAEAAVRKAQERANRNAPPAPAPVPAPAPAPAAAEAAVEGEQNGEAVAETAEPEAAPVEATGAGDNSGGAPVVEEA